MASAQSKDEFTDGPYVQYFKDSIEILWVVKGELHIDTIHRSDHYVFKHDHLPEVDISGLRIVDSLPVELNGVDRFVAISDIHGQFDLFLQFLRNHNIVDQDDNWIFGKAHLVIVGDVLDRGPKVIEALWYLYELEQKARNAGGGFHFLLGNHEMMVINNDLRYLHNKYKYTEGVSKRNYDQFFDKSSFFGKWLASKNIAMSINDFLCVHGGISEKVGDLEIGLDSINQIFRERILHNNVDTIRADTILNLLARTDGPLWYRGYAYPSTFSEGKAKKLLKRWDKKAVIVGHTSVTRIKGLYKNRIILIDSSIKRGESGEILSYNNGDLYRGLLDGSSKKLISEEENENKISLFDQIYTEESPSLSLKVDLKEVEKNDEDSYQPGILQYRHDGLYLSFNAGVQTSGNVRRRICNLPPLKLNLKNKEIHAFGFTKSDKLKLLRPCKRGERYENYLRKEHLLYDLYRLVDSTGLRSKLISLVIKEEGSEPKESLALLVEHKENFAMRLGYTIVEEGTVRKQSIDKNNYLTFCLFNFIVANPDFHLATRHNLRVVKKPGINHGLFIYPYDFDSSGFINAEYAGPPEALPIKSTTERYFMDKTTSMKEMEPIIQNLLSKEKQMIDLCLNAEYLSEKERSRAAKFLERSFNMLRNPKKAKKMLGISW